jgi:hypothetical protein
VACGVQRVQRALRAWATAAQRAAGVRP